MVYHFPSPPPLGSTIPISSSISIPFSLSLSLSLFLFWLCADLSLFFGSRSSSHFSAFSSFSPSSTGRAEREKTRHYHFIIPLWNQNTHRLLSAEIYVDLLSISTDFFRVTLTFLSNTPSTHFRQLQSDSGGFLTEFAVLLISGSTEKRNVLDRSRRMSDWPRGGDFRCLESARPLTLKGGLICIPFGCEREPITVGSCRFIFDFSPLSGADLHIHGIGRFFLALYCPPLCLSFVVSTGGFIWPVTLKVFHLYPSTTICISTLPEGWSHLHNHNQPASHRISRLISMSLLLDDRFLFHVKHQFHRVETTSNISILWLMQIQRCWVDFRWNSLLRRKRLELETMQQMPEPRKQFSC